MVISLDLLQWVVMDPICQQYTLGYPMGLFILLYFSHCIAFISVRSSYKTSCIHEEVPSPAHSDSITIASDDSTLDQSKVCLVRRCGIYFRAVICFTHVADEQFVLVTYPNPDFAPQRTWTGRMVCRSTPYMWQDVGFHVFPA